MPYSPRRWCFVATTNATSSLRHFFLSSRSFSLSPFSLSESGTTLPSASRRDFSEVGAPMLIQMPLDNERTVEVYRDESL